jgi:hypothetical protein
MIGKIRDTLIGLWPVVKTYIPKRTMVIAIVIAFLLGLAWSYLVDPIVFTDAEPRQLGQSWQDEWVRLVADRYNNAVASSVVTDEFRQSIIRSLSYVDDPQGIATRLGLSPEVTDLATQAQAFAPATPPQPNLLLQVRPFILGPLVIAIAFILGSLLFGFYINPLFVEPVRKRIRGSQGTDAVGVADIHRIQEMRRQAQELAKQAETAPASELGPPVVRHVSIYTPGRAYDDSFSIEDATRDDEFLGECGAVISETIGVGQPQKVTAIEVWLFDKEDFVKTVTTVIASEHAFNDPATRAKLSAKGDVILAKPGEIARLETSTLRLQARIVDMAYGSGPLPPNSYFDKMTLELQTWRKSPSEVRAPAMQAVPAAVAPAVAVPPPAPVYTPPIAPSTPSPFAPAPLRPASPPPASQPTYGGGLTPLRPPPVQAPPPRRQDDDPFGGTGDFTPVS